MSRGALRTDPVTVPWAPDEPERNRPSTLCPRGAMTRVEPYENLLASQGISLESLGLTEIALARVDALRATEVLALANMPVLGGDVYIDRQGRIEVGFSNWYTDREDDEPRDLFASRSWEQSRTYISKFPEPQDGRALFVLVVGDG